jgi:eukaryotic-like serine/threonine-protein kinase
MAFWKQIRPRQFKKPAIVLAILLVLFYLFNNIFMPRYVQQGKTTKVPNVIGKPLDQAFKLLADAGLVGKKAETKSDKQYPEGTVVVQIPPADAEVKFGRGIYLTVSGGEPLVVVPGLRGLTLRAATFSLEKAGLALGTLRYEASEDYPLGNVIDQETPENTKVLNGKVINLVVSQGKSGDQVPVPDLTKRTFSEAEKIVILAGLRVGNITYQVNAELLPNTVIDQFPKPGQSVPTGQAIDLVVAQKGEKVNDLQNIP